MPETKRAKKTKSKTQKPKRAMPKFGKPPAELVSVFETALKNFPMAQQKLTFGAPAAYVNGKMFCGLVSLQLAPTPSKGSLGKNRKLKRHHNDKFILRLSQEDCEKLFAHGATPFEPMPGRAMKGWVAVSRPMLADARELNAWMGKAFEHTKALPPKK